MFRLCLSLAVAFVLWFLMFSPLTAPHFDFWLTMSVAAALLTAAASLFGPAWWRRLRFSPSDLMLGLAIAVALWAAFWVGDKVASELFDFARPEVDAIYGIKEGIPAWGLSLLLLCLIGPAEEIFWRGYVQERLARQWGATPGFLIATALYAAVHVASCNFMLTMAALVAGTVWGLGYRFFPQRFAALVLSHALWDAAVFVWFPIM